MVHENTNSQPHQLRVNSFFLPSLLCTQDANSPEDRCLFLCLFPRDKVVVVQEKRCKSKSKKTKQGSRHLLNSPVSSLGSGDRLLVLCIPESVRNAENSRGAKGRVSKPRKIQESNPPNTPYRFYTSRFFLGRVTQGWP